MKKKHEEEIEMAVTILLTREIVELVTAKEGVKLALEKIYGMEYWEANGYVNDFVMKAERNLIPVITKRQTTTDHIVENTINDLKDLTSEPLPNDLEAKFQHYLEGGK